MSRLHQTGNEPIFVGAVGRVYIRRNAGFYSLKRIKNDLKLRARGRFAFARWDEWTIVDLETQEDLVAIREKFANLLDGWSAFS